MEQGEEMKVKTLRERFENDDSSKIRTKPAIPEKPKTIPPISPTAKINNPLIASINSAMENHLAPRVVFKDDKKKLQVSQPQNSLVKAKPILLDKNQKKEADLIKQALKDKNILPLSPVTPVLEQTPKPVSIQKSPDLETPVKVSTPYKKTIFNKTAKYEKEKTQHPEWDVPATPVLDHSDSSISTQRQSGKAEATVNKPVVPKALVPAVRANPTISAPVSSPPAVSVSKPSALTDPEPVSQNGPQMENPRPDIPFRLNSNVISPTADIFSHGLPEKATSIPEIPDILHMGIPPPIIREDFSDGGTSVLDSSANVTPESSFPGASLSVTPDSSSPALSHAASAIPATETPDSDAVFIFSPFPASLTPSTNVESMEENRMTESHKATDNTEKPLEVPLSSSPKTISVVSALARAEEMIPVKHNSCDQRLLNLLEKAKRKSTVGSQLSTPEMLPVLETDLPSNAPFVSSPPETAHTEPLSHMDASDAPGTLPDIPSVDYEGNTEEAAKTEYNTQPTEAALNDQDHRKSSPAPKMVIVQKPIVPPPPPPRKPQSTIPNGGLIPEKPPQSPSTGMQSTVLPNQPLEDNGIIIPAPADFTQDYSTHEDSQICDPSETVGSQAEAPDYGNLGPSVHEEAFSEHLNLEQQTPNMDTSNVGLPRTVTTEHSDSVLDPLFNPTLPSPSGKQTNYSNTEVEDLAVSKKNKTAKKQRKGSPMNPYADTPVVTEEIPKKALFSKKNSVSDEKDLKSKEKQKQKDKEKEKEKEKKELKEKEKKEQKEKEKDKELKEKDKEKKEQKDKKKEQKEKERDKKELKEKEREKKEQKEKEKKENEMKKKFRTTGEEEALYQAKVTETTKGRKDDLAIKAGEIVSIIRTTDCPKGKWLARDNTNKYGYIPVESLELNIQEMMVLGNKAKAGNMPSINGIIDPEAPRTNIISSSHYSLNQESFEDDSEEWGDDDDTVFPRTHTTDLELNQRVASPDIGPEPVPALPAHTDRSDNVYAGQEALQKLTTFFAQPKVPALQNNTPIKEPAPLTINAEEPVSLLKQEIDLQILPPPDLYADIVVG